MDDAQATVRQLGARRHAITIGWRTVLFLVLTLGFPFVTLGLAWLTDCRRTSGACGAVALISGLYLKPLIMLAYMAAIIRPSWRRARSIGLHPAWALLLPFLILASAPMLLLIGTHWSVGFVWGAMSRPPLPFSAMLALLLMAWLAVMPSCGWGHPPLWRVEKIAWIVVGAAAVLAMVPFVIAVLQVTSTPPAGDVAAFARRMRLQLTVASVNAWAGPASLLAATALIATASLRRRRAAQVPPA